MKPKTKNAVRCAAYQGRKREQDAATDRRRTASRTLRQSKRDAPANPADELVEWCKRRLKVPAGHALAGQAMALPEFAVDFLRDALQPDCHTGWLLVPRKNGKSQALASLVLAYLADGGPLRRAGFRSAVVSITKPKASELKKLAAGWSSIAASSFTRPPPVGRWYLTTRTSRLL